MLIDQVGRPTTHEQPEHVMQGHLYSTVLCPWR